MKTQIIALLFVCMVVSAVGTRSLNEASPPPNHGGDDVESWGWQWPWFPMPFYPLPPESPPPAHHHSPPPAHHHSPPPVHHPPPPVHHSPPPSSPEPQQPRGDFNDPAECETALASVDSCVGDLISYFFGTGSTIGQPCCNRIKRLSQPCFGRAFMDEPSYYNQVNQFCS